MTDIWRKILVFANANQIFSWYAPSVEVSIALAHTSVNTHKDRRELSRMLFNHRKAEIEALLSPSNQIQSSLTESGLSSLLHYLLEKVKDLIVVNQECVLHWEIVKDTDLYRVNIDD